METVPEVGFVECGALEEGEVTSDVDGLEDNTVSSFVFNDVAWVETPEVEGL